MKKQPEKLPIDDLFARKLGNMSLPPSDDAFERLQARMGNSKPEARVVFWRNPVVQRYMAIAACLLLVCLFGWQYWSGDQVMSEKTVAVSKTSPDVKPNADKLAHQQTSGAAVPDRAVKGSPAEKTLPREVTPAIASNELADVHKSTMKTTKQEGRNRSEQLAVVKSTAEKANLIQQKSEQHQKLTPTLVAPEPAVTTQTGMDQVADNSAKPVKTPERVLIVTIAEPAALIAARSATKESNKEPVVVATADKPEVTAKSSKIGNLWQQVKRVKEGEVFARQSTTNDERGLLGRAYSELKQSIDKNNSAKQ